MKFRHWLVLFLIVWLPACVQGREIRVSLAYNNLSDSYLYPYQIRINSASGIPASLIGCSDGVNTASLATISLTQPPYFVVVEWEHLLTRKTFRARIELSDKAGKWWRKTPFQTPDGKPYPRPPTLVVQWRGPEKVVAMLVADFTDFSKGTLDLGVATGTEIERPDWGPKLYLTYDDLRRKPGDKYRPGRSRRYERGYDNTLTNAQRFGCPRLPNGRLDATRLPPEKLPYVVGADGEHIPCAEYFCRDKQALIKALRKLGWRRYPDDARPPAIKFQDAPNPRPAR